jgi:hypothetical protein
LPINGSAEVEKFPERRSGEIEVYSPEEVWPLVRVAEFCRRRLVFATWPVRYDRGD